MEFLYMIETFKVIPISSRVDMEYLTRFSKNALFLCYLCSQETFIPRILTRFLPAEHPSITQMKRRVVIMMFIIVIVFTVSWLPFQLLKICGDTLFLADDGRFYSDAAKRVRSKVLFPYY